MSAIQFLREKAGVFVAVVIGVALLLFVVSDFFGGGRGQRLQAKKYYQIGEIAGEYISYQDFDRRVQSMLEIYKLSGAASIDEATTESVREQVWQQMVREHIQDKQYHKLGIGVSTEETEEMVLGNDPHPIVRQLFTDQTTGMFNKSFLVNFLKQTELDETANRYWLFFEDEIVNERMNSKYNNLVSKGLYVTSRQAEFDRMVSASTVDFSYIMKNYALVPDSLVRISKSEIESYYSKNKERYRRNALRNIEYVTFSIDPSEEDIRQTEDWIMKTREEFAEAADPVQFINLTADSRYNSFFVPIGEVPENLREFVRKENKNEIFGPYEEDGAFKLARLIEAADRPDSVHARHILIAPGQTRDMARAKVVADSLVRLIKSGSRFEVLAMTNSDDQGSAQIGGDLGWFREGMMVTPFNDACFTARKGEILTAETNYGIHIIEILDKSRNTRKYNIGVIDRKIMPSSATNQRIYSAASQFAGTNNTLEKFNNAISEMGLKKLMANDVSPQQKTLPGLENPRSLVMALFSAKEGQIILDNNQQAVFELGDDYVVAFCTRVQEEGIAPLSAVETEIRLDLMRNRKADIISDEFARINPGNDKSLDELANAMGLTVQEATGINFRSYSVPGAGTEPALVAAASAEKHGVVAGPVKGSNGVFMFFVNGVTTSDGQDLKHVQENMLISYQMRGGYEAYEALRKSASIVDKRYKFY
ncbi:MAG TPA: SurA N-terminal domain-containing protein [Bacteroidales bacterium]|jgi:peptidyl-prolyl cis-trans isomerase D|nr:SurA N-terminal domain-containing protein [Bacteroidales bacterium]HQH23066.1 SurA N-terminal domain-containing protein [Bacteroidales bacterium]HQJ82566.1 SurA N-terminal domain-containing protein [Bacteroidales bacterium]